MRTSLPDEQGWYWAKAKGQRWFMVFVSTNREEVYIWDGDDPVGTSGLGNPFRCGFDAPQVKGILEWHGPFQCPGGDFGGITVVADAELHEKAKTEHKVIGIQHFDYRYCRDEGHGSSLTISGVYARDEALRRIHREVKEEEST